MNKIKTIYLSSGVLITQNKLGNVIHVKSDKWEDENFNESIFKKARNIFKNSKVWHLS